MMTESQILIVFEIRYSESNQTFEQIVRTCFSKQQFRSIILNVLIQYTFCQNMLIILWQFAKKFKVLRKIQFD